MCSSDLTVLKGHDKAAIDKAKENLERKAHKLAEKIYKAQGGGAAGAGGVIKGGETLVFVVDLVSVG